MFGVYPTAYAGTRVSKNTDGVNPTRRRSPRGRLTPWSGAGRSVLPSRTYAPVWAVCVAVWPCVPVPHYDPVIGPTYGDTPGMRLD